MTEGMPQRISEEEVVFVVPKPRFVPTIVFQTEARPTSIEEHIETGKALIVIGLLELLRAREDVAELAGSVEKIVGSTSPFAIAREVVSNMPIEVLDHPEGESIGTLLMRYRTEQVGMTQAELAARAHIDVTTVSRIESRGGLRSKTLRGLFEAYGWDKDDPRAEQITKLLIQEKIRHRESKRKVE